MPLTHNEAKRTRRLYRIPYREVAEMAGRSLPWAHDVEIGRASPTPTYTAAIEQCATIYRESGIRPSASDLAAFGPDPMEPTGPADHAALLEYANATTEPITVGDGPLAIAGGPPRTQSALRAWMATHHGPPVVDGHGWERWMAAGVASDGAMWAICGNRYTLPARIAGPYLWCLHHFPTTK